MSTGSLAQGSIIALPFKSADRVHRNYNSDIYDYNAVGTLAALVFCYFLQLPKEQFGLQKIVRSNLANAYIGKC